MERYILFSAFANTEPINQVFQMSVASSKSFV